MAKLVNLKTIRKQRARDDARKTASVSAAQHGEAKPDKSLRRAETARMIRLHDGAKRDP